MHEQRGHGQARWHRVRGRAETRASRRAARGPGLPRRWRVLLACVGLGAGGSAPALAQDTGLDALLFLRVDQTEVRDLESRAVDIYRIPLSYKVLGEDGRGWGLRITFPVTLGSYSAEARTDVGAFIAELEAVSIIPGVELDLPLGRRWRLKPFAEVGIGRPSGGNTEVLYGAGVRTRADYPAGRLGVILGGAAAYKTPSSSRSEYDGYSRLEAGVDLQWRLRSGAGGRKLRGGTYGIVRRFFDNAFEQSEESPVELQHQYELGVSFSTDPVLRAWKVKLPWIGLGYRFGDVLEGVRLYLAFPF